MSSSPTIKDAKVPRPGTQRNPLWKELKLADEKDDKWLVEHHTHQCKHCSWTCATSYTLNVRSNTVSYQINQIQRHLFEKHEFLPNVVVKIEQQQKIDESKRDKKAFTIAAVNISAMSNKKQKVTTQSKLPGVLTWRDIALCKQAMNFIYSTTRPSMRTFRCPRFREMLAAIIPTYFSFKGKPPILEYRMLKKYVTAEYKRMVTEIQSFIRAKSVTSFGNAFCQLIHDGCTLKNGIKVQSVGLQFIDPNFVVNHDVCL